MKINYLSASTLPSARANSVHVMKMCSAFARNRHAVTLFAYRSVPEQDLYDYYDVRSPFPIRPLPNVSLPGAKRLARAFAAARGSRRPPRPDLLYGRDLYSLLAARDTGLPMIYEAHMPPQNAAQAYLIGKLLDAPSFVRLIVISAALAKKFSSHYPRLSPERVIVAHDAADPPTTERAAPDLQWLGRPAAVQIGYAGSLLPGKGAGLVAALAQRLPQFDFHLLGGSPDEVRRLERHDEHGNLFTHGHVEHQQVAEYLRHVHIALLPSQRRVVVSSGADIGEWMSPLKLFEYMACRLAIVASALPVMQEVLGHEENALLVPPDDVDAWIAALERLAADQTLRERLARRAFEDFHERYTWTKRSECVLAGIDIQASDGG